MVGYSAIVRESNLSSFGVDSTLGRYNLRERCRHGEARSVDQAAVNVEQARISKILAKYPMQDQLNFVESGLFAL